MLNQSIYTRSKETLFNLCPKSIVIPSLLVVMSMSITVFFVQGFTLTSVLICFKRSSWNELQKAKEIAGF